MQIKKLNNNGAGKNRIAISSLTLRSDLVVTVIIALSVPGL